MDEKLDTNKDLWNSLKKYEQYVVTNEDLVYGYNRTNGYPMYLFNFGLMYFEMYKYSGNDYYYQKFLRCVDFAGKIRNEDWTWSLYNNTLKSSLYNSQATELFIKAWKLTGNKSYIDWAMSSVYALNSSGLMFEGCYNNKFYAFVTIAAYCYESEDYNCSLVNLGMQCYNYSISGYNCTNGYWFYNSSQKADNFYNGRSAYYQLQEIIWFLENSEPIKIMFPNQYIQFKSYLPSMISKVTEYILPSGTFYYTEDAPNYTESAGNTIFGYKLYDSMFSTNHIDIIECAKNTIIERQDISGGYYKTVNSQTVDIWFTDNVGLYVSKYLNIVSNFE